MRACYPSLEIFRLFIITALKVCIFAPSTAGTVNLCSVLSTGVHCQVKC